LICLNYFRFFGPIAEWEKKVGSLDLVHLSGGLLVKKKNVRTADFVENKQAGRFILRPKKEWVSEPVQRYH
jgi:hypothetical protein